jgi:hypothetical protein
MCLDSANASSAAMTQAVTSTYELPLTLGRTTTHMNLSQTKAVMWRGCRLDAHYWSLSLFFTHSLSLVLFSSYVNDNPELGKKQTDREQKP